MRLFFPKLALLLVSLAYASSSASAESICLVARSTQDPMSGHAFVTVKSGSSIVETYGFWPEKKLSTYVAINRVNQGRKGIQKYGDLPFYWLRENRIPLNGQDVKLSEDEFCVEAGRVDLERARANALAYLQSYGVYRPLANNCTHFAIRQFNAMTGLKLKVRNNPLATRGDIRKLRELNPSEN